MIVNDEMKDTVETLANDNGSLELLAAYISRELGGNIDFACDLAYILMDSIDEMIQSHVEDEEEVDD